MIKYLVNKLNNTKKGHELILKLAYDDQAKSKEDEFKKMVFSHIDSRGQKYFKYRDDFEMCTPRLERLEIKLLEWNQRVKKEELHQWIDANLAMLTKALKAPNVSEAALQRCIYMNEALKDRTEIFFDPEILIELMCIITIREDEDPFKWNVELQTEKKQQISDDIEGGLSDFFLKSGLNRYIPSLKNLTVGIKRSIPLLKAQKEAFKKMNTKILQSHGR